MLPTYWTHVAISRSKSQVDSERTLDDLRVAAKRVLSKLISAPNAHGLEKLVNPAAFMASNDPG